MNFLGDAAKLLASLANLDQAIRDLRAEVAGLRDDVTNLRTEIRRSSDAGRPVNGQPHLGFPPAI